MAFYDLNVTKPIIKSNGTVSLPNGGTISTTALKLGGILDKLILLFQGTATYTPGTGSIARDVNGGANIASQISIIPNQQVPIIQASGYGLYLFNLLKENLEGDNNLLESPVNAPSNVLDNSYVNSSNIIAAPSGTQSPTWTVPIPVPIVQRMFNGIVGYWELGNPLAQLSVQIIPGYGGTSSPYNIYSTTAGTQPYFVTGNATVTLANPVVDIMRYLYDTPVNPQDRPPVTFINVILEDTFQQSVGSAKSLSYTFAPLSGYIARVITYINDSSTGLGVAPSLLLNANSLTFGIGDGTTLITENIYEYLIRQRYELGTDMPRGAFYYDFLGKDLTFQNVFSTYDYNNINLGVNMSSAIGAGSYGKVVRQMLKPLQYTAK
jgi:hypothetical protein